MPERASREAALMLPPMRIPRASLSAVLALGVSFLGGSGTTVAQDVPSAPPRSSQTGEGSDPRKLPLEAAQRALDSNDFGAAEQHLLAALWFEPFAPDALASFVRAAGDRTDVARMRLHQLAAALADAKGSVELPLDVKPLFPADDPDPLRLVSSRAAAVAELATYADREGPLAGKSAGSPVLARHARFLAWSMMVEQPALWSAFGRTFDQACGPRANAHESVVAALKRLIAEGEATQKLDVAIHAASCLHGLACQAGLKDVKGPKPPDLSSVRSFAAAALAKARDQLVRQTTPYTIEQLELMSEEERLAFTNAHATPANPGIAMSRTGRYRIETTCGHGTLLGAAESVEFHHERLVNFFGGDPFVGKLGVVRIVPEASGLEAEGTPFWWAGGFQSGDITTLRFNAGSIPGLGRGLTHELTHRFDGAVNPGIPAWLAEGKAVWTGAAYGQTAETTFVENHISPGTIDAAMRKGYGGLDKLKELVEGKIEDYRDNYTAGYALYAFLNTWHEEGGEPLYRERLVKFQKEIGQHKSLWKWFEQCFCDGKSGRPAKSDAFAKSFNDFLWGFYWLDPKPWTIRYTDRVVEEPARYVFDAPTWGFARNRAEPWFGQDQSTLAGEVLLRLGKPQEAVRAFVWAHEMDEPSTPRALKLADLLEKTGDSKSAFALRAEAAFRTPHTATPPRAKSPLLMQWPRLATHVGALNTAARAAQERGQPLTAAFLGAEHDRLASLLGLPLLGLTLPADSAHPPRQPPWPLLGVPHDLATAGLLEEELTGYEEYRTPNLWYWTKDGDLHVGRERPREDTGVMDRTAHQRHAYVRGQEWFGPGAYRIRTRIHFTTTFVSGAVILGITRRDRNLRLDFSAGDYMYSIGQAKEAAELKSVSVRLHGIRDGEVFGQEPARNVDFPTKVTSFPIEIVVDGPMVLAFVNEQWIGTYHTVDGQPVEGFVGFASSMGAYRAEKPTIERLDRVRAAGWFDPRVPGLTLEDGGAILERDLLNRTCLGLPVHPNGTIVVWLPRPKPMETDTAPGEDGFDRERLMADAWGRASDLQRFLARDGYDQSVTIVLPDLFDAAQRAQFEKMLKNGGVENVPILFHKKREAFRRDVDQDGVDDGSNLPWVLFIDPAGVLRMVAGDFTSTSVSVPEVLRNWLELHRGRRGAGGS
jgi:hypothetical protein